jgi:hypothetical protein
MVRAEHAPALYQNTMLCDSSANVDKKADGNENKLSTSISCKPLIMPTTEQMPKEAAAK